MYGACSSNYLSNNLLCWVSHISVSVRNGRDLDTRSGHVGSSYAEHKAEDCGQKFGIALYLEAKKRRWMRRGNEQSIKGGKTGTSYVGSTGRNYSWSHSLDSCVNRHQWDIIAFHSWRTYWCPEQVFRYLSDFAEDIHILLIREMRPQQLEFNLDQDPFFIDYVGWPLFFFFFRRRNSASRLGQTLSQQTKTRTGTFVGGETSHDKKMEDWTILTMNIGIY